MALADSITALGTAIINLVGTRLNRDANNFSTAGTQNLNNMIDSRIGAVTGAPVGTVIAYMGTDEPEGFLLMDGRELSRTTYAALFAVIGTSQGAGNGSTTFNIADMTDGRYLMGSTVAGSSVLPSAPNIYSNTSTRVPTTRELTDIPKDNVGAFYKGFNAEQGMDADGFIGNMYHTFWLTFDASYCSEVYGRTPQNVITVSSKTCKFFIRYM